MMYLLVANGVGPEFIKLLIGLVFLVGWVIRKIAEANKQAAPPKRPELPPQLQKPPQPGGAAPVQGGQQADQLRAQVEEFLRRAGKTGQPNAAQVKPKNQPAEIQVFAKQAPPDEQRTIGQPLRQATWRNAPPQQSTAAAADKARAVRAADAKKRRRQSVAEHVAEQVTAHAQTLADKAAQLGQRIAAEDQMFDVQLKSKFDHAVGTLAGTAIGAAAPVDPAATAPDTPAAQLAAMLREPAGIRQAVLVNEILRRPSERW